MTATQEILCQNPTELSEFCFSPSCFDSFSIITVYLACKVHVHTFSLACLPPPEQF